MVKFKAETFLNESLLLLAGVRMAKILIVYDSKTGNTEKMAFAVAEGAKQVEGIEVVVKRVEKASLEDLLAADGIIMGSPTYYGQMSAKLKALIDESVKIHGKLEGKVGAAFTSSGGTATGAETTLLSILGAHANPRNDSSRKIRRQTLRRSSR
jgi:NAD(P)H dehydrogenase (quinone)